MTNQTQRKAQEAVIRRLPMDAVNRIAAGEVIERPAAAVKEIVENAIDAGAQAIDIEIRDGGKAGITVTDDGRGMDADDLLLAVERHATSKLAPTENGDYDLTNIQSMGFRGEALPSIGAVARLDITARRAGGDAARLSVHGGKVDGPKPSPFGGHGARVEVRDLFYATPARLKFLKSDRAETMAVTDTVKRLAMAFPDIGFSLTSNGRRSLSYPAETLDEAGRLRRLGAIMGRDFEENALAVEAERDGARLTGFAGLPTFNRGLPDRQFLFVNGRPVRDKLLTGALRAAYQDFLARDRHPAAALFLDVPPHHVDVNVHPAKTEVRFRDAGSIRGLIVGALRHALAEAGHRASTTVSAFALGKMQSGGNVAPLRRNAYAAPAANPFAAQLPDDYEPRLAPVEALSPDGLGDNARRFDGDAPAARADMAPDEPAADPARAYPLG
ncbi:MAG: DNA mismatch repair endonuclease MutL, partial [Pseudomonadota bacterium]